MRSRKVSRRRFVASTAALSAVGVAAPFVRGAYAAGTVALSLTRRYHGLLIAPVDPPLGRSVVCAKADATLNIGDNHYPLFTNRWAGGTIGPPGHVDIEEHDVKGPLGK